MNRDVSTTAPDPWRRSACGPRAPGAVLRHGRPLARGRSSNRAFTLVELVLTILVIGLAATIVPAIAQRLLHPMSLDAAALQFQADLRHAQQLAIARRISYAVAFSEGDSGYRIVRDPQGANVTERAETLPHGVRVESTTLPGDRARFDLVGNAPDGGDIVLSLTGSAEKAVLTVDEGSGAVGRTGGSGL